MRRLSPSISAVVLCAFGFAMQSGGTALAQDEEFNPFSVEELQEIVGPVALYPDPLLGHVLAASTMPVDIAKAVARLNETDGEFDDEDEVFAALDPHIQSLLPFRDVLDMMSEFPDWTAELGSAMVAQEEEVIDAIQAFRHLADEAGNLEDSEQLAIVREEQIIKIQPADPQVIYVPVYQPQTVIGKQPVVQTQTIVKERDPTPAITFVAGIVVGAIIWNNSSWSTWGWSSVHFRSRSVVHVHGGRWWPPPAFVPRRHTTVNINRPTSVRVSNRHAPSRWRGSPGRAPSTRPSLPNRPPSGDRPSIPNRPPSGDRPSIPDRPPTGNRPSTGGSRPSLGNRPSTGGTPSIGNRTSTGSRSQARPTTGGRTTGRPSSIQPSRQGSTFSNNAGRGSTARRDSSRGASSRGSSGRPARGGRRR